MSIEVRVLGAAGRDNALLLYIHGGESLDRLLFDCGDACLAGLPFAEIQRIDHLFFSHLHMDHIGGFDAFFRTTYNRTLKPNLLWGPPQTARILHHRFQGFLWNLTEEKYATWEVCDIAPEALVRTRFELHDAFAVAYPAGRHAFTGTLIETPVYTVEAMTMDHRTPSLAYLVREKPRQKVDISRLEALGLPPGPWLRQIKSAPPEQTHLEVAGTRYPIETLRAAVLNAFPGDSVAYLTDFLLDDAAMERLAPWLAGCGTIVCESAYRQADDELARRNYHMTTARAAELARRANAGKLILIHLSDRYPPDEWPAFLAEARAIFPNASFPRLWDLA